jgi:hypothetical protein
VAAPISTSKLELESNSCTTGRRILASGIDYGIGFGIGFGTKKVSLEVDAQHSK